MVPFLADKSIVLQGRTIKALSKIAKQDSDHVPFIFQSLIQSAGYLPGNRIGFLIEFMEYFKDDQNLNKPAQKFVQQCIDNELNVVARKAMKPLKKVQSK